MEFRSLRFAGDPVLEEILNDPDTGTKKLKAGSDAEAVRKVQQAFFDLGWTQRISPPVTDPSIFVIGVYGPITTTVVLAYKTHHQIRFPPDDPNGVIDGFVGPRTLRQLDADCFEFDANARVQDTVASLQGAGLQVALTPAPAFLEDPPGAVWSAVLQDVDAEIYWREDLGTFVVVEPVLGKYRSLGAQGGPLGYPTGNDGPCADGEGRNLPCEQGGIWFGLGEEPVAVVGEIHQEYLAQGAEAGPLGYPVADQVPHPDDPNAFVAFFQSGAITLGADGLTATTVYEEPRFPGTDEVPADALRFMHTASTAPSPSPLPTTGNDVQLFVNGIDSQRAMVGAIERATRPGDFVYLLGWWLSIDYVLDPASPTPRTLQDVFTAISPPGGGGCEIRAIVWRNKMIDPASLGTLRKLAIPPSLFQNVAQVGAINDPSKVGNGAAILDNRTKIFGSHHQKVLIVSNQDGLTAFCGGVDFNPDRVYAKGAIPAVTAEGAPLHDVHLQIRGPAAVDLLEVFRERWFTHPDRLRLRPPTAPVPPRVPGPGRQTVQVLRTYGKSYPYPRSVRTAQATLVRAIGAARQHVYLEDQYFVGTDPGGMQIHDALLGALASIQQLIILITDTEISDMPQVGFRRHILISSLRAEAARLGKKFGVYRRIDPGTGTALGHETYVHAKVFIVDDELACVGSVNSSRRSYTYDSEAQVAVYDTAEPGGSTFAKRLRLALWGKHLNLSAGDPSLADPIAAGALWDPPGLPPGARVAPFNENLNAALPAIPPPTPADEADIDRLFKFVPLGLPGLPFPPGLPGFPFGLPGIPVGPLMVKAAWRAAAGASGVASRVLHDFFWNAVVDPLGPP